MGASSCSSFSGGMDEYSLRQMLNQYQSAANGAAGLGQQSMTASEAQARQQANRTAPAVASSKGKSMFGEIATDMKSFILEHRSVLYFLAIALVLDHVLFKDAFKHRLQGIVDKIIQKAEDGITK